MDPVQRSDWNALPMPALHTTVALDRTFTADEMEVIRFGVLPDVMEDKWFIFWEGDCLHFHRSWTGNCIYIVRFADTDDGSATMIEAKVNRDPEQYEQTDDAMDASLVSYLMDVVMLQRYAAYPRVDLPPDKRALAEWGEVGQAMLFEGPPGDEE